LGFSNVLILAINSDHGDDETDDKDECCGAEGGEDGDERLIGIAGVGEGCGWFHDIIAKEGKIREERCIRDGYGVPC